jgi:hypothetical protein
MKVIGRTLIILSAALLVVGATLLFARSSLGAQAFSGGRQPGSGAQGGALDGGRPFPGAGLPEGAASGFRGGRGDFERGGGGLGASTLFTLGKDLGVITLIVLLYILLDQAFSAHKKRRLISG